MAEQKMRAKNGYLSYNDMFVRISEGLIDEYDVVYTTDTKECYVVTPELVPVPVTSRVYIYDSISKAEEALNANTDTYEGQLVSVLYKDAYRGFIVNKKNGVYYLVALSEITEVIDYDSLGNKPILSMIGTLDSPVILSKLSDGVYSIKGQYQVTETDETVYLGASYNLFCVEKNGNVSNIKKITSKEIIDYHVEGNKISATSMLTEKYLESCGYATTKYVDDKFTALDVLTKEETKAYIEDMIREVLGDELDALVDTKINAKLQPIQSEEIIVLF